MEDEGIKEQAQIVADVRVLKNFAVDYTCATAKPPRQSPNAAAHFVATPVVTIPIAPLLLKWKTKVLRSKLR